MEDYAVCRELSDLVNGGYIQLISGSYNESDGSYKINLKSSQIHLASRGFKDSIPLTSLLPSRARTIAMTFTRVILRVQTEIVYLHVQLTTPLRPLTLQSQHIMG